MKSKYILLVLSILIFSCKNQDEYRDVVYFTGTETSSTVRYSIEDISGFGVSVSASNIVQKDVAISIAYNEGMIEVYNKKYNRNYKALPKDNFILSSTEMTIKEGTHISQPIKLSFKSIEKFEVGVSYLIPLTIKSASDMPVLESSRSIFLVINRTLITKAANLGSNYFTVPGFASNPALGSVPQVTMEARIFINKFESVSPFISSVIGLEENFLLRFGDVGVDPDKLQLAGGGYQLASTTGLATGTWNHVAIVYDGAKLYMYVNGKLDASRDALRGDINLADTYSGGFHIGFSVDSRRNLDGAISECRVWSRALSQAELVNNLCYVDPTTEGLLAYWRFNGEAEGKEVPDLTGNGYTAKASYTISWVEGVRCP